jgi:urea carboxylase
VKPGGYLELKPTTFEHALELVERVEVFITDVQAAVGGKTEKIPTLNVTLAPSGILEGTSNAIIRKIPADEHKFQAVYRQGGDCFLLVDIGKQTCDVRATSRIRLLV